MPSVLHEGVLQLVRTQPTFATVLLRQLLDVEVPRFSKIRIGDPTLNQIVPVEYHADVVVMFESDTPVFGAIIEAQLQRDDDKPFSWPAYATCARARHRRPVVVVVVTRDKTTARWAARRIDLGGGNTYRPLVLGPRNIPVITDRDQASHQLHLAMLSVIAHGRGNIETASAIGAATFHAILQLPEEQRKVYMLVLDAALSKGARKTVAMQPGFEKLFSEAQQRDRELSRAEGKAEGKIEDLLKFLAKRGIALSDAQRQQILECRDLAVLDGWLDRILSVTSADELFT